MHLHVQILLLQLNYAKVLLQITDLSVLRLQLLFIDAHASIVKWVVQRRRVVVMWVVVIGSGPEIFKRVLHLLGKICVWERVHIRPCCLVKHHIIKVYGHVIWREYPDPTRWSSHCCLLSFQSFVHPLIVIICGRHTIRHYLGQMHLILAASFRLRFLSWFHKFDLSERSTMADVVWTGKSACLYVLRV